MEVLHKGAKAARLPHIIRCTLNHFYGLVAAALCAGEELHQHFCSLTGGEEPTITELGTVDWTDDESTSRATAVRGLGESASPETQKKHKALCAQGAAEEAGMAAGWGSASWASLRPGAPASCRSAVM